jgi:hypothetical protein
MASAPTGNDIQAADLLALARLDDDGAPLTREKTAAGPLDDSDCWTLWEGNLVTMRTPPPLDTPGPCGR